MSPPFYHFHIRAPPPLIVSTCVRQIISISLPPSFSYLSLNKFRICALIFSYRCPPPSVPSNAPPPPQSVIASYRPAVVEIVNLILVLHGHIKMFIYTGQILTQRRFYAVHFIDFLQKNKPKESALYVHILPCNHQLRQKHSS